MSNLSLVEQALTDLQLIAPALKGGSASLGLEALTTAITVAEDLFTTLRADFAARSLTPAEVKDNIDAATEAAIDARFPKG